MNSISSWQRPRLERWRRNRRVGGADERVTVPRNREHHAAVRRVRHHDRRVGRQKGVVEHQMNALARRDQRLRVGLGQPAHRVGECAGRIDDHARRDRPLAPGLLIGRDDAVDEAVGALRHRHDADVVDQRRALFGRGRHEVDQQPRIVELAVVVDDAAAQTFGLDGRQPRQRLLARQDF